MKLYLIFGLFYLLIGTIDAQSLNIDNIHFRIIDDKIEIFYDLPENHDTLFVKIVFYKESNPEFKYYPKFIKGNVGLGLFSGVNNLITWYFKKEPEYLFTGDGFYFKILANKIPKIIYPDSIPYHDSLSYPEIKTK